MIFLLEEFADWEAAYISSLFNQKDDPDNQFQTVIVGIDKTPIRSIGGLTVLPDISYQEMPEDHAGLVLIGGTSWRDPIAQQIVPMLNDTLNAGKLVAAICDATCFLGKHGFLNSVAHTSNGLDELVKAASPEYTNEANYQNIPAVTDGNIITANGTSPIEFAREVAIKLGRDEQKYIDLWYGYNKLGEIEMSRRRDNQNQSGAGEGMNEE